MEQLSADLKQLRDDDDDSDPGKSLLHFVTRLKLTSWFWTVLLDLELFYFDAWSVTSQNYYKCGIVELACILSNYLR